jgi:hypothetical protein
MLRSTNSLVFKSPVELLNPLADDLFMASSFQMRHALVLLLWLSVAGVALAGTGSLSDHLPPAHMLRPADSACPCPNPLQCAAVANHPTHQIFAFQVDQNNYPHYDWQLVTTVAATTDAFTYGLMCYAHSHNVRVVYLVDFPKAQLTNATARTQWVNQWLMAVRNTFTDGVSCTFLCCF